MEELTNFLTSIGEEVEDAEEGMSIASSSPSLPPPKSAFNP
jgi:hypothetical protein